MLREWLHSIASFEDGLLCCTLSCIVGEIRMSWLAVYFEVCVTLGHNAKCARPPDLTILKRPFVLETAEELPGRVASRGMNIILEALMRCSNDASRGDESSQAGC